MEHLSSQRNTTFLTVEANKWCFLIFLLNGEEKLAFVRLFVRSFAALPLEKQSWFPLTIFHQHYRPTFLSFLSSFSWIRTFFPSFFRLSLFYRHNWKWKSLNEIINSTMRLWKCCCRKLINKWILILLLCTFHSGKKFHSNWNFRYRW